MTDKEKKMLKDSIINIFENFNVLDHTATIGGLKNDILKFINSMQEEPVSEDLEEAIDTYLATYFGGEKEKQEWPFLKKMAIYFAEWQEAKDKQVLNDDGVVVLSEETFERMKRSLIELAEKEQQMMEKAVSEDLGKASKEWLIPQLDKSYANYGEAKMMELTHFDGYAMLDAIEFGAKWQFEIVKEALLSEVLPCFMHGGEADEVVAKLDEVLNQKK